MQMSNKDLFDFFSCMSDRLKEIRIRVQLHMSTNIMTNTLSNVSSLRVSTPHVHQNLREVWILNIRGVIFEK